MKKTSKGRRKQSEILGKESKNWDKNSTLTLIFVFKGRNGFFTIYIQNKYLYDLVEITNKMQPCFRIYYSTVHWRLNMFRAAYRSSSGALTVFAASGLHTHVVTGRSQLWVGTAVLPVTTCVCKPEAANTVRARDDERYAARNNQVWVGTAVPTQTWLRPVTTCVCKPEAANTVRAPDDERYAARNMLSLE